MAYYEYVKKLGACMPVVIERKDKLLEVIKKNIFADNHPADISAEGILEGFHALQKRPEIQELDRMFKDYIDGKDEQ